ncbi:hypothetical protein OH492_15590 [Vibrio chagasii]|nr:hypothetical protein [Vibrio chagasii]
MRVLKEVWVRPFLPLSLPPTWWSTIRAAEKIVVEDNTTLPLLKPLSLESAPAHSRHASQAYIQLYWHVKSKHVIDAG